MRGGPLSSEHLAELTRACLTALENLRRTMHDTCSGTSLPYFHLPHAYPMSNSRRTGWRCRPETVESLFIAFRLTGDKRYRDHGWNIFQAIEKHCKIPSGGYATIINVDQVPVRHEDKMEAFFLVSFFFFFFFVIFLFSGTDGGFFQRAKR